MTNLIIRPTSGQKNIFKPSGGRVGVKSIGNAPATTVLLSSDWSTTTGTSNSALLDDGKSNAWDQVGYGTNRLTVVSATGFDFPAGMSNIFRVTHPAGTQNYSQVQKFWDQIDVGETIYYRWYNRIDIADSEGNLVDAGYHPMETPIGLGNFTTNGEIVFKYFSYNDGTFVMRLEFQNNYNKYFGAGTNFQSAPDHLDKFKAYRFEMALTRVSTGGSWDKAALSMKIFDDNMSTTVPLWDDDTISGFDFDGGPGLHNGTLSSGYGQDLDINAHGFTCIETGTNGGGWTLTAQQYSYWGGFRVQLGDWCGPYVPGES